MSWDLIFQHLFIVLAASIFAALSKSLQINSIHSFVVLRVLEKLEAGSSTSVIIGTPP